MIVLNRIDNRLIHGQVVEAWLPHLHIERIVVADDEAAGDPLTSAAMQLAFSPQYLFTLLHLDSYLTGVAIDLPIYVVNDAQRATPVELTARIIGPTGIELAAIERALTLPADCMAMEVERLRLTPDSPGSYRLALALHPRDGEAITHEYEIVVE